MFYQFLIFNDWALLIARVAVGFIFLAHGLPKLRDLKTNAQNFAAMGFRPGALWGTVVAFAEPLGALALLAGFYAQIAASALAVVMLVASAWKLKQGMKLVAGYELDLALLATLLLIATSGAGAYSIDKYISY